MAGKVSAELNAAINSFLTNAGDMSAHMTDTSNPHSVTKTQVGLANVTNDEQATKAEFAAHTGSVSNPHSVTKSQVGLSSVTNDKQATEANFNAHTGNTSNPHSVTKAQVGLGSVDNAKQATKAEYNAHVAGTTGKHSATDIIYNESHSVKSYVDQLALESGTGTMDHSLLVNRDSAGAHPLSAISGVNESVGHIYTFKGVTTDTTETELFTEETGEYIDEDGRIKVPVGAALGVDIKFVWAAKTGAAGVLGKRYAAQSAVVARSFLGTTTYLEAADAVIIGTESMNSIGYSMTANNASTDGGDGSVSLKVAGLHAPNPVYWKAIVTITPVSFAEFE